MASPTTAIEKTTVTLAAASASGTSDTLSGITDTANCVPFLTTRITSVSSQNDDEFQDYTVRADFLTSPNRVRVQTANSDATRAMIAEVAVVEFDSTYTNVYSGTATITDSNDNVTVTNAFGGGPVTVDMSKAWLYFTWTTQSGIDEYERHAVRGQIGNGTGSGNASTLFFDCAETHGSDLVINWWVVECKNTEWSVQTADLSLLATTGTSDTDTFTAVNDAKTFILGSHKGSSGSTDGDGPDENLIDVKLTDSGGGTWNTVTGTRQTAGAGQIDWHGYIIEFASGGNENVYRNTFTWSPDARGTSNTDTISMAVTIADSMVHLAGHTGNIGGGHWKRTTDSSNRVPDTFTAWTITGTTEVTLTKMDNDDTGGETDQDLSWEVIEWDAGGAPPATSRRVMVIT